MHHKLVAFTILTILLTNFVQSDDTCDINERNIFVNIPELGTLKSSITKTLWTDQNIIQFLGIPYAESPSKDLRFKPPVPKKPWIGVKDVTEYGRRCPSISSLPKLTEKNKFNDLEDCLNLCIYTKELNTTFPVMVYLHGGYFYNGSAADYPPHYLLEKDIVLVVIQYRIGVFGFLSTQTKEIPGNVAVLDIILGLKWIQKYIHYFGGDSWRVTIFGQSAGAALTSLLTISPIVPNMLFDKAIIQSGSIFAPWALDDEPIKKSVYVCHKVGCKNCTYIDAINKCLMEIPTRELIRKISNQLNVSPTLHDLNGVLPKRPKKLMADINKHKYQLMIGATKHDGLYPFAVLYDIIQNTYGDINAMKPKKFLNFMTENFFGFNDNSGIIINLATKIIFPSNELLNNNYTLLYPGLIDLSSILTFKSPILHFIDLYSQKSKMNNYLYSFDYKGQYTRLGYEGGHSKHYPFNGGVHHSDDNIYLFPYPYTKLNKTDRKMVNTMVELWTSFAIYGQPKAKNNPKILPVKTGTGPYFKINTPITIANDYLDEFIAATNDAKNLGKFCPKKTFFFL